MPNLRRLRPRLLRRRAPRPLEPRGIQLAYYAELKLLLGHARRLVRERLLVRLPELLERATLDGAHLDAGPGGRVNRILDQISAAFFRAYPQERLERIGAKYAQATSRHQRDQLFRQVKAVLGVDLTTIADRGLSARIRQFTAENVALIKTLPQTYFDDVEKRVLSAMRQGERHERVAEDIEARFGAAESRARLIARDQVLSFQADLNRVRQQELGVRRFRWMTATDERVREAHAERDGQVYEWDDPPGDASDPGDGAYPGQGINCRCWSDPVLEDVLEELEQWKADSSGTSWAPRSRRA